MPLLAQLLDDPLPHVRSHGLAELLAGQQGLLPHVWPTGVL